MTTISGSNRDDNLVGTNSTDVITAGNGNDSVLAGGGNDIVSGGNGDDTISGEGGDDNLSGGNGSDVIDGGEGADVLTGGNGDDVLNGGAGVDFVSGENGDDIVIHIESENTGSTNVYDGGNGRDTLRLVVSAALNASAAFQAEVASFQAAIAAGQNSFHFNTLNIDVRSFERVEVVVENVGPNLIVGDDNPNTLIGTAGVDIIQAFGSNDILQGLGGDDELDGGTGFDRAVYIDATGGVTINLAAGTASGAGVGNDTLIGIEAAQGSNFADTFDASAFTGQSDVPGVPAGFSEFEGMGGNDLIVGRVTAGGSLTRISYASATAAVAVDLQAGTATGDASVGTDTFSGVGHVRGSAFADALLGSNNVVFTRETFEGRAGNDFINGRGGFDLAVYNFDPAVTTGIVVNLAAGSVTGDAAVGTDTLSSVEGVRGTRFDDVYNAASFSGASANAGSNGTLNEFEGFGGNDSITGNGNTLIAYGFATAGVTVDIAAGTASGDASVGSDTFSGVTAVIGSGFADNLLGSNTAATEVFTGNAGNDFVDGRGGFDNFVAALSAFATSGISVDLASGVVTGDASIGMDTLRRVEGVQGTFFVDTFDATGFSGSSLNAGSNGTFNQFEGLGGDDITIGNGFTVAAYGNATAAVNVNLATGIATSVVGDDASVGTDTLTAVTRIQGSNFDDILIGDGASNIIDARGGNDFIDGGANTGGGLGVGDRADYNASTGAINVQLAAGTVTGNASVGTDTLNSVEGIIGSNFNDIIDATGFSASSTNASSVLFHNFATNGEFNQIEGRAGNDTIIGNGFTELNFFSATAGVVVNLNTGVASGDASVGTDSFSGVDSASASPFNDTLIGNGGDNVFSGRIGDDTISGGGGNDLILGDGNPGEQGNDVLTGGTGNDTIITGDGDDTIVFADGDGGDFVADFQAGAGTPDVIDLTGVAAVSSLASVLALATEFGSDTFINFGNGDSLMLTGVVMSDLHEDDFIFASSNLIVGDEFINVLLGTPGNDTILGLGANDTLIGGLGGDILDGGGGSDMASYQNAVAGLTIDLGVPTNNTGEAAGDTYISIEDLRGSAWDDQLFGDDNLVGIASYLEGGEGADYLDGRLGPDFASYRSAAVGLTASLANSAINTGEAAGDIYVSIENLEGGAHDDTLIGDNFNNFLHGGGGADTLEGGAGSDTADYFFSSVGITVSLANPMLNTGDAAGDVYTSIENIRGGNWNDTLIGNGFNNTLIGAGGADTLNGGNGSDTAYYQNAIVPTIADLMNPGLNTGDAAGDTYISIENLRAAGQNDQLFGDNSNNFLEGGGGADVLDGRLGSDSASYANATSGVTASLLNPAINTGDAAGDTYISIENLSGSAFNDILIGDAGNNFLRGNLGADVLDGGDGSDTADYFSATSAVTVDLLNPANNTGEAAGDTYISIQSIRGSAFNDFLYGDNSAEFPFFANFLEGGAGADYLDGRGSGDYASYQSASAGVVANLANPLLNTGDAAGDTYVNIESLSGSGFADTLTGDSGNNFIRGGGGADIIDGGDGFDFVEYQGSPVGITASLANPGINTGEAAGDTFTSIEGLRGGQFADTLIGDGNDNRLIGGDGGDMLDGGLGIDTADYQPGATGGVTANLGNSALNTGFAAGDTYTSIENLRGSNFDDNLSGNSGDNVLSGLGGADTFSFGLGFGDDTISDFVAGSSAGHDVIAFDDVIFDSFGAVQGAMIQDGADVLITAGSDSVRIVNTALASLEADNFIFT